MDIERSAVWRYLYAGNSKGIAGAVQSGDSEMSSIIESSIKRVAPAPGIWPFPAYFSCVCRSLYGWG